MLNPKVDEAALLIGQFYLRKNSYDYTQTAAELYRLHIKEIAVTEDDEIVVTLGRPGLFIGKRATNIDELCKFLNRKVKVVEDTNSLYESLIPRSFDN